MKLSARERNIAIGAGVAILLFILYTVVVSPYLSSMESLTQQQVDLKGKLDDAALLFARDQKDQKIWADLKSGGLKSDTSLAESQMNAAIYQWTQSAGVHLDSFKSERNAQEGSFDVMSYDMQGTGTTPQITNLLWAIETAPIPVRINELQLTPKAEGTDNLTVRISISTLCQPPPQPPKAANAGGGQT